MTALALRRPTFLLGSPDRQPGRWHFPPDQIARPVGLMDRDFQATATTEETTNAFGENVSLHWVLDVVQRVEELLKLKVGWDGYRSSPVDGQTAIYALEAIARSVSLPMPHTAVAPLSGGGVQFEWRHNGKSLDVIFYRPYEGEMIYTPAGGEEEEYSLGADVSELERLLKEVAA